MQITRFAAPAFPLPVCASARRLSEAARDTRGRWALAHLVITSVIQGAGRLDQLADTLSAADLALAAELKKQFDELAAEFRRGDAAR